MSVRVRRPRASTVTAATLGMALIITGVTLLAACGGSPPQAPAASPSPATATVRICLIPHP